MRIWVNGCFDVLHKGHVELFKWAKSLNINGVIDNELIVGIDNDSRVRQLKGENRPYNNLKDRLTVLDSIKYIDDLCSFGSDDELERLILNKRPHIMVVGEEYKEKRVIGGDLVQKVMYFPRIKGYSTTKIINYGTLPK